jgi:hypothetical protein
MIKYIKYDINPRIKVAVIVKLILKTCEPYKIRYPRPFFETKSSPIITPINDILILILKALIKFTMLLGKITLKKICVLVADILFIKRIKLLSTEINPLYMFKILTKVEINNAIIMIDLTDAPNQIIINGPKATLGKEFKIVKYGSRTSDMNLFHHKIVAIETPIKEETKKLNNVSYKVTPI